MGVAHVIGQDLALREEERQLPLRGLRGVRAVDEVELARHAQVPADGARLGLVGEGLAHELPGHVDGPVPRHGHEHDGPLRHELDEPRIEGLGPVRLVVLLRRCL